MNRQGRILHRSGYLVLGLCLFASTLGQADGLIERLPEDGTWARYSLNHKGVIDLEGTVTLASVGQEQVKGEACRWIELVIEVKSPDGQGRKDIFKGLIPEKRLRKGETPALHWIKGWMQLGDQQPQQITPEQLAQPQLKLNLFAAGPLQESKPLPKKTIATKLGDLECEGSAGHLALKGAAMDVVDGQVTRKDMQLSMQTYSHEKAPFGVAWAQIVLEVELRGKKISMQEVVTLREVGKDATGQLPKLK